MEEISFGLKTIPGAERLLGLRVRIPPGSRMSLSCECLRVVRRHVERGLCFGLITRLAKVYRV